MTAMPCTSHEIKTTLLVMLCLPQGKSAFLFLRATWRALVCVML